MKKLLLPLLILALVSFYAVGETLYCASEDAVFAADFSSEIVETDSRLDALDALTNGGAALLTQQELIEALQGYSEVDVTTDIQLIRPLGQGALYVVCSAETAGDMRTLGDLVSYLSENEYALAIMRCFEASNADYASMVLMDTLALDSEMFVDEQDKWDCVCDGPYVLVAEESKALELQESGCVTEIVESYIAAHEDELVEAAQAEDETALMKRIYNGILPDVMRRMSGLLQSAEAVSENVILTVEKVDGKYKVTDIYAAE